MCLLHRFSVITAIVMFLAVCAAVVGTAGSQYSIQTDDFAGTGVKVDHYVYLYASQRAVAGGDKKTTYYSRSDFTCKSLFDKYTAAFALGLVSILTSLVAFILAIVRACTSALPRIVIGAFCFITAAMTLVAFALSLSTFKQKQCDDPSFDSLNYMLDWGWAILVICCGLSILGTVFGCVF